MSELLSPSIFESFNARALEPAQVAGTFVPSAAFEDLLKRRHTLVVGPRGSGKTTLLKMLQLDALRAWTHVDADRYRGLIEFTGVYIPTDISWSVQISSLGDGDLDETSRKLLSVATFTTHTLRSLIIAFESRTLRAHNAKQQLGEVVLNEESEAELSALIAARWQIEGVIPSFAALRWALSDRLRHIFSLATKEIVLGPEGRKERLIGQAFLHLHFLSGCGTAIEIYEDIAGLKPGKWALLFDELELAPKWIQEELGSSLRSTDPRFLFKLALNPFTENDWLLQSASASRMGADTPRPAPDQDFDQIPLWYVGKVKALEFCSRLWYEMLQQRNLPLRQPDKILGSSYFGDSYFRNDESEVYRAGSKAATRFANLAAKDPSFAAYLNKKGLKADRLADLSDNKRASDVRKVAPIVAVREFYRRPEVLNEPEGSLRSRKTAKLYSGAESLFAITEGNPRWFIGIVGRLLEQLQARHQNTIQAGWQAEQVRSAAERFQAMLSTIPVPPRERGSTPIAVLTWVAQVANFFHERIVRGVFQSDPPGTFRVDDQVSGDILPSLARAINAGALVYIPDGGPMILSSLEEIRGKRFRISYLLAPLYGLPLRLGKAVALSTILRGRGYEEKTKIVRSQAVLDQLTLLESAEQE